LNKIKRCRLCPAQHNIIKNIYKHALKKKNNKWNCSIARTRICASSQVQLPFTKTKADRDGGLNQVNAENFAL
jgi:hypothetical protein